MPLDVISYAAAQNAARKGKFAVRRQLVPMATNCVFSMQSGNALSDGVLCGGTARAEHVVMVSSYGLRLVFSNWYANSSFVETSGPNTITVKACIDYPDGFIFPVTFGGQDSVEIAPGGNVVSDPIGLEFTKGTTFHSRTWVAVNAGEFFPRGGYATGSAAGPTWHNYANPAGLDLTRTGAGVAASGYQEYTFGPSAMLGHPITAGLPVVGIVGDSIAAGTGDNQAGWVQRWLNPNYATVKAAIPGEGVGTGWGAVQGLQRYRRYALMEICSVSHVIGQHIVNDLGTTYATLLSNQITYWTNLSRLGPVWATTCTPQTTSTDSWATLGNQTLLNSSHETNRLDYNGRLRDGFPILAGVSQPAGTNGAGVSRAGQSGHPLNGWLEVADLCESARNSGKWRVDLGQPTADGTHPTAVVAAAIAAGLPSPTNYFGAAAA